MVSKKNLYFFIFFFLYDIDPEVKAIVSSGYSTDPIAANFKEHGFKGEVGKPYEIDNMLQTASRVLEE